MIFLSCFVAKAQSDFFIKNNAGKKINFELANNLIVIPLEINGVSLSFILDTGVSKPILFNLSRDSLDLGNTKMIFLNGLGGDGKLKALKSSYNRIKIGNAVAVKQDIYVVYDKSINFTSRIGVLVHGIIGYNVFKDFVVEINYNSKYIRLHKPNSFRPKLSKKWKLIPINVFDRKPYLDAKTLINDETKQVKLLIDTGSSDSLWLFEDNVNGLKPQKNIVFRDYLGRGLSGSVYGKRSKVENLTLSNFNLEDVNVAFPDSTSIKIAKSYKDRNGSIGANILKRFNFYFDYTNGKLYLKKNSFFNDPFTYNNSGIVLEFNGMVNIKEKIQPLSSDGYRISKGNTASNNTSVGISNVDNYLIGSKPIYKIVEIRKSSNAYISGLREGDVLISMNRKSAFDYSLSEINKIFHGKAGKTISLTIQRSGKNMPFKFQLDNVLKSKELSN